MVETMLSQPRHSVPPSTPSSFHSLIFRLGRIHNRDNDSRGRTQIDSPDGLPVTIKISPSSRTTSCSSRNSNLGATIVPQKLDCDILVESGQTNLIDIPSRSAGAMLSGQVKLAINEVTGQCRIQQLKMILRLTTKFHKSGFKGCEQCAEAHQDLKTWNLTSEARKFSNGSHYFPWSFLLPGNLPATTHSALGSVEYTFVVLADMPNMQSAEFVQPLIVHRIVALGQPTIVRTLFPSSGLRASLKIPSVVSASDKFDVSLSVRGIIAEGKQTRTIWRLQQLYWHVVEQTTTKTVSCGQHRKKSSEEKVREHAKSKILGNGMVSKGWDINFKDPSGEIILNFEAFVAEYATKAVTYDVRTSLGLEVKHQLILEFTFSESLFTKPDSKKGSSIYGSGRLIRMSVDLPVYERACDEISWDQETPPAYLPDAVTPPHYDAVHGT